VAVPITSRAADAQACAQTFENTAQSLAIACSGQQSFGDQLVALSTATCTNATNAASAALAATCALPAATGVAARAGASPSGCVSAFEPGASTLATACGVTDGNAAGIQLAGLVRRDACADAQAGVLAAAVAGCGPPSGSGGTAGTALTDAANAGLQIIELAKAATKLADTTTQAAALTPSLDNCQKSLTLVNDNVSTACGTGVSTDAGIVAAAAQACDAATAAALAQASAGCGALAAAQKANAADVSAGVKQAAGVSCSDATNTALLGFLSGCDDQSEGGAAGRRSDDLLKGSAGCTAAQANSLGLLSAACPAAK
jgi:hypothetical protein